MKFHFSLTAFCLFVSGSAAFSQNYLTQGPSVEFSKKVAEQVAGAGEGTRGILNCHILLTKEWAYPNAQVTAFCNDAETSCLRYALILQRLKIEKGAANIRKLKNDASLGWNDTELRLRGCQLAIEASANNYDFISELGGRKFFPQGKQKY